MVYKLVLRFPLDKTVKIRLTYVESIEQRGLHTIYFQDSNQIASENRAMLAATAAHAILSELKTPSVPARVFGRVSWLPEEVKELILSHLSRLLHPRTEMERILAEAEWHAPIALFSRIH